MAYLNANIPIIECYVRGNYLRDQKDSHDKYFECTVFGFSSILNLKSEGLDLGSQTGEESSKHSAVIVAVAVQFIVVLV